MQYRLRTLVIALAVAPPLLALLWAYPGVGLIFAVVVALTTYFAPPPNSVVRWLLALVFLMVYPTLLVLASDHSDELYFSHGLQVLAVAVWLALLFWRRSMTPAAKPSAP